MNPFKVVVSHVPRGTVIAATPDQATFVKTTTKWIAGQMGLPPEQVEPMVWQYLIDKGVVTALTNVGTEQ
jgi:hypothetical protein